MLGALVLILTGNFQVRALEPPLFLQHRFDRATIAKSEESERNRQTLIVALEQQKWTLAQFEKAKAVMLQRAGYLANREVLHWHLVKNLLQGHAKTNTSPTPKLGGGGGIEKVTSLP